MVRPESWTRPASVRLVRVIAREPGSRPRQKDENPSAERGVESLRGGSKSTGRSDVRVLQPRHIYNGGAEPLISRRRPCPTGPHRVSVLPGPSGVWGSARTQGLGRNRRDPSVQPRQQRPLV